MKKIDNIKAKVKNLKKEVRTLYIAYRRPDVPWYTKAFAILVVGYALSPVDLIPDFIPILGYLDDLILIPLGVAIAIRMIPKAIIEECRNEAEEAFKDGKPKNWFFGTLIILTWLGIAALIIYKVLK